MKPQKTKNFDQVKSDELRIIRKRNPGANADSLVGLALSGGGIRSATFSLGVLQAFERYGMLKPIDYLSTVSGGGYIGSSLTWFMTRLGYQSFPYGTSRKDHAEFGGKLLQRLRSHGNYLTPGSGISLWALIAAIISGMTINFLVVLPIFFLLIWALRINTIIFPPIIPMFIRSCVPAGHAAPTLSSWLFFLGIMCFAAFLVILLCYALTTRWPSSNRYLLQTKINKYMGYALMTGTILVVIGTIPLVYRCVLSLSSWISLKMSMSSISLAGIVSVLSGFVKRKPGKEAQGIRSFLMSLGLSLITYGLFLWFYHLTEHTNFSLAWCVGLGCSVVIGVLADINQVSMHRFYRNRLMEAYMPYRLSRAQAATQEVQPSKILDYTVSPPREVQQGDSDQCNLCQLYPDEGDETKEEKKGRAAVQEPSKGPYHIINANMHTVGSKTPKLRERGGDNFIFSPLYCGAESTKYIATSDYEDGRANLATAMAISGAAVDPNTYATRSRPLSFLMTLLNIRLGYWICNPSYDKKRLRNLSWYYMFVEMFGRGLDENRWRIHLSDGGHFENLGIYELIKRRCRYIIVCDATEDPNYNFNDLGQAIERVRVDFGAKMDVKTMLLKPARREEKISPTAYVTGKVVYEDGTRADIIYISTTLVDGLTEDIYTYRRQNPSFPDQGTGDQFFDERQFEAYRELGFQIGTRLFGSGKYTDFYQVVQALKIEQDTL